jgi:hypothetical protein
VVLAVGLIGVVGRARSRAFADPLSVFRNDIRGTCSRVRTERVYRRRFVELRGPFLNGPIAVLLSLACLIVPRGVADGRC